MTEENKPNKPHIVGASSSEAGEKKESAAPSVHAPEPGWNKTGEVGSRAKSVWNRAKTRWNTYYGSNSHTVAYAIVGFIVALALLCIGFWRTLLFAIFIVAGVAYGQYRDGNPRIVNFFKRIIDRFR